MSSSTNDIECQEYQIEEFIRKVGQTIFSDEFCDACDDHVGEVVFNNQLFTACTTRIAIIKYVSRHYTSLVNDFLDEIIREWNILMYLFRKQTFGKQVYIHPSQPHIVCEMSGYSVVRQNEYVYFRDDHIMIGIFSQMQAVKMCFGDDYQKAKNLFFGALGPHKTPGRALLDFIENLSTQSISKDEVEYWYNPIARKLFISRWNEFLEKHLLEYCLNQRRPIKIQIDDKYHDTMNDKIEIDKSVYEIETVDE